MNQIEIERKWLLYNYPQCTSKLKQTEIIGIEQYYTPDGWRYRREHRPHEDDIDVKWQYFKLRKEPITEGISNELDISQIALDEYLTSRKSEYPIISKRRIVYKHDDSDLKFEMDDFWKLRLLLLEIELPDIKHKFEMPANIGVQIIMEVTGMKEFSNKHIAEKIKIIGNIW
jgi:CYTH domain-containing protein